MATAAAPRGSASVSLWKPETTYGVAASGNYTRLPFYKDNIMEKQALAKDPLLGLALQNQLDPSDPAPDLPSAGGQVEFPLDLAYAGFPLDMVFGAPTTSGTTPNYTHVFNSGGAVIPHWTRELQVGPSLFSQVTGVIAKKLAIEIGRKAGYDRMTVDFLGRKETKPGVTGGGTPAAMLTRVPLPSVLPVFKFNTVVVADVISMSLTYDNGVTEQDYLGDANGYPLGHDTDGETDVSGTIRVRLRGTALWDAAKQLPATLASGAGEILWSQNANRSLSFAMAQMWLEQTGVPVTGKGRIEQEYKFTASQGAAVPALVATLKSPTATFP